MALIGLCCYDTKENQRSDFTRRTLESLSKTVDWNRHRLIVVDNNSCEETKKILEAYKENDNFQSKGLCGNWVEPVIPGIKIVTLVKNIGTAEAINLAWHERRPGEHCVKMDNDVVIHQLGWLDDLEECIRRDPRIGQIGLKRKDLEESPLNPNLTFKSSLHMIPHQRGEKWLVVERVKHVIGTCVLHSSALLDRVGYLFQLGVYAFDDSFMSHRSIKAGFINCFLPGVEIDHIDPGGDTYTEEKRVLADKVWVEYQAIASDIIGGRKSVYYNPFTNHLSNQTDRIVDLEKTTL